MLRKEFDIRDILVSEYIYDANHTNRQLVFHEQVPAHMMEDYIRWTENEEINIGDERFNEGIGLAYVLGYDLVHYKGLDYMALELNALESFVFWKYYVITPGFGDDWFCMLEDIRAFRYFDGRVDLDMVIGYNFYWKYKRYPSTSSYRIYDLEPDTDSYCINVRGQYDRKNVVNEVLEKMKR